MLAPDAGAASEWAHAILTNILKVCAIRLIQFTIRVHSLQDPRGAGYYAHDNKPERREL